MSIGSGAATPSFPTINRRRSGDETFRTYLVFLGPSQEGASSGTRGISGLRRFLDKVWTLVGDAIREQRPAPLSHAVEIKRYQTVKKVPEGLEELGYNTSIAALMELVNTPRAERRTVGIGSSSRS